MAQRRSAGVREVLQNDEVREILREAFFTSGQPAAAIRQGSNGRGRRRTNGSGVGSAKPRPEHYKVICISMYNEDLDRLDAAVRELKRRGYTKANRSAVLRMAMEQINLDHVRRGL